MLSVVGEYPFLADPETGDLLSNKAPLIKGVVPIIDLAFFIPGLVFARATAKIKKDNDVVKPMYGAMSYMGGYIILAGEAPHEGINSLNAATLSINNINTQRETFNDEDKVRAGYLPMDSDKNRVSIFRNNILELIDGEEDNIIDVVREAGSTDLGDLSQIIPCLHPCIGGVYGSLHTKDYNICNDEMAYILPAKAMTIIDLLFDNAKLEDEVISDFKPNLTKDDYLKFMDENKKTCKRIQKNI